MFIASKAVLAHIYFGCIQDLFEPTHTNTPTVLRVTKVALINTYSLTILTNDYHLDFWGEIFYLVDVLKCRDSIKGCVSLLVIILKQ